VALAIGGAWDLSVRNERQNHLDSTFVERRVMARGGEDPKVRALRAERSLNPRPEAVSDERFSGSESSSCNSLRVRL
jgi:hypothetical protein